MQQLFPHQRSLELTQFHDGLTLTAGAQAGSGRQRAWIALGMVSSLDGGAALAGDTSKLGGAADQQVFRRLRASADAILVGAGTVRDENYGPPLGDAARRSDRAARGLAERPRLVVVSHSMSLDTGHRVFSDARYRPLIITHEAAPIERVDVLAEVADVVRIGEEAVDLSAVANYLADEGLLRVLCEGGPSLNGALLAEDLVDELFLTVAAVMVGGGAPRIAHQQDDEVARNFEAVSVHEHEGELLLRYCRSR